MIRDSFEILKGRDLPIAGIQRKSVRQSIDGKNMNQSDNQRKRIPLNLIAYLAILAIASVGAYLSKSIWLPSLKQTLGMTVPVDLNDQHQDDHQGHDHDHDHDHENGDDAGATLTLSPQARRNLDLKTKRIFPTNYWARLVIPGEIVDRPGVTDRSLTSPIAGVITDVHAQQGDIISPGDRLVTVRLVSDYLQKTQSDLFKAVGEIEILDKEIARIQSMADRGIIPEKRIIALQQDVQRQQTQAAASRQDLVSRGFNEEQVLAAERGNFLTSIEIKAPKIVSDEDSQIQSSGRIPAGPASFVQTSVDQRDKPFYEIQELITELGHQVASGERIAVLSDHQHLLIRGHAFKREAANIERVMQKKWNVDITFVDDSSDRWPKLNASYKIRHLSNEVDSESNTFDFFLPLENQSRVYRNEDRTSIVWRYRPGQQVRLRVPVNKIENVFVLPKDGVIREGAEVYAFQSLGKFFRRFAVHVIFEDSQNIVLANDGSLPKNATVALNGAASLNRVLKSQSNEGVQELHVHADGTVHSNDDH